VSIETWGPKVTAKLREITTLEQVHGYDSLPSNITASPTVIWLPVGGSQSYGLSAPVAAITRIQITLYLNAALLPEGVKMAVPFIALVRDKFAANMKLDGTVNYILPPVDGNYFEGPAWMTYKSEDRFTGINFFYDVKEIETITVSA